jgi:Kdo2-lipid IVA lauroyltransferase/acyltransferase
MEAEVPAQQRQQVARLIASRPAAREPFARWLVGVQRDNHPAALELARSNLLLAFPKLSTDQHARLLERNQLLYFAAKLEEPWFAAASEQALRQRVPLHDLQLFQRARRKPLVVVCPHLIGHVAVTHRLTLEGQFVALYAGQAMGETLKANPRFKQQVLLHADANGVRGAIREMQRGRPLFVMPDLNPLAGASVQQPFFGRQVATSPLITEVVKHTGADVLALLPQMDGSRYAGVFRHPLPVRFSAPLGCNWAQLLNPFFENEIRRDPACYWWGHPRFAVAAGAGRSPYSPVVDMYIAMTFGFSRSRATARVGADFTN